MDEEEELVEEQVDVIFTALVDHPDIGDEFMQSEATDTISEALDELGAG